MRMDFSRYGCVKISVRNILIITLLFISYSEIYCQSTNDEIPPIKERLFYGGSFGLQFGTITDIELSPIIGLWVLPRLGVAAGPSFRYYKNPYDETTIYGGKSYVQYNFLQDLDNVIPLGIHAGMFLQGEYELLSLESSFVDPSSTDSGRFLCGTFLVGGGISQQLGTRSSMNLSFLWAINDSGYGIYGNPEIRISFTF